MFPEHLGGVGVSGVCAGETCSLPASGSLSGGVGGRYVGISRREHREGLEQQEACGGPRREGWERVRPERVVRISVDRGRRRRAAQGPTKVRIRILKGNFSQHPLYSVPCLCLENWSLVAQKSNSEAQHGRTGEPRKKLCFVH